jgi:hypothetical protein
MVPAPPPYHVVWKIELVEEGADDAWLEKNPGYDGAHAAIFVPIFWDPHDPKTAIITFAGVDGRTGGPPAPTLLDQVWRALALHLSKRPDLDEARRAFFRRVLEESMAEGRKERRKKEQAERGASLLTEAETAEVLERLKPLAAEAIARATRLQAPLSEYCAILPRDPSSPIARGLVVTRAEARELIPPEKDRFGVVAELEEPRLANEMIAFVMCGDTVAVVRVELTSVETGGMHN